MAIGAANTIKSTMTPCCKPNLSASRLAKYKPKNKPEAIITPYQYIVNGPNSKNTLLYASASHTTLDHTSNSIDFFLFLHSYFLVVFRSFMLHSHPFVLNVSSLLILPSLQLIYVIV